MGMATGKISEQLAVVFTIDGREGEQTSTVALTEGYTTRDDIPTIVALPRGVTADKITIKTVISLDAPTRTERLTLLKSALAQKWVGGSVFESRWQSVTNDAHCARGYVWGWQDAQAEGKTLEERLSIKDTGASFDFSQEYAIHSARYECEQSSGKTNIPDAWRKWCAGVTDEAKWIN